MNNTGKENKLSILLSPSPGGTITLYPNKVLRQIAQTNSQ